MSRPRPEAAADPALVARRAREAGLTYVDDDGSVRVIQLHRRARVASATELRLLAEIAAAAGRTLRRLAGRVLEDPLLAAALPLEPEERAFLAEVRRAGGRLAAPVLARVDTNAPFGLRDFRKRLRIYEVNGVGVGGLHYAPAAERVLHGLLDRRAHRRYQPLPDLARALAGQVRRRAARSSPRLALCEDAGDGTGTTEFRDLAESLRSLGVRAALVDPRSLHLTRGRLSGPDGFVDLVYRDTEIRDLLALRAPAPALTAWRHAFVAGKVLSGPGGDLDHKSLLEVLTDPDLARRLPPGDRRILGRHALWTRLLRERVTFGPDGLPIDLVPWTRANRSRLALKPNRLFGGKGVVLGPLCDATAWEAALAQALAAPDTWVVQAFAPVAREAFPDGGDLHVDAGLLLVGRTLGILSRAARDPVVNVARGGGLAPVLRLVG
jgi:hypothetical protein